MLSWCYYEDDESIEVKNVLEKYKNVKKRKKRGKK